MAQGEKRETIAVTLKISKHTVNTHVRCIYSRLNCHMSGQALAIILLS